MTTSEDSSYPSGSGIRFASAQRQRTLIHPLLEQSSPRHQPDSSSIVPEHTFVVCADTQFGMTNMNQDWELEKEYSRKAVQVINDMEPRPLFCCVCGDLVDMTALIYASSNPNKGLSEEACHRIQDAQNKDFQSIWKDIHPDIALVCLCGNHDVGNRPTHASIDRFVKSFGDDYLSWWANGTYNLVLNTSLFANPTGAPDLYQQQLQWLEDRLEYATQRRATNIFVFGHHPWFLYREDETSEELNGYSPFPNEWGSRDDLGGRTSEKDGYFHIPLPYRQQALRLFEKYHVSAAFSGHFHQNLIAQTSFGMEMIVTGPLSLVFESTGIPEDLTEPKTRGLRVVRVCRDPGTRKGRYEHTFVSV